MSRKETMFLTILFYLLFIVLYVVVIEGRGGDTDSALIKPILVKFYLCTWSKSFSDFV